MARTNPHRPFVPDPAQMALRPPVSGNVINGLGEPDRRPASTVYWAPDPDDIPHGAMQKWFYTVDPGHPDFAVERAKRTRINATPLPDVAATSQDVGPDGWRQLWADLVQDATCDAVGAATMSDDWLFEGHTVDLPRIIVMAVQHDYDQISTAPAAQAGAEVMRQYTRAAKAAMTLAARLREMGWQSKPLTGPMAGAVAMIPAAIAAGLGELGKHGSAIMPAFGSSFRLSAVLTDAPVPLDQPQVHGVDDFCASCRICEDACPPEAILPEKQTVRGQEKWYVDFDRCLPFFNQHQGCAICIAVCPWSRPGVGLNLAQKYARRTAGQSNGRNSSSTEA